MVPKPTNTESRINGYDHNSYIKAASCVVALDVVYLQSMPRTRSDRWAWRALSGLLANGSGAVHARRRGRRKETLPTCEREHHGKDDPYIGRHR